MSPKRHLTHFSMKNWGSQIGYISNIEESRCVWSTDYITHKTQKAPSLNQIESSPGLIHIETFLLCISSRDVEAVYKLTHKDAKWAKGKGETLHSQKPFLYQNCPSDTYLNHGNKRHHLLHILLQLWQGVQLTGNYFIIWQLTSTDLNRDEQSLKGTATMKNLAFKYHIPFLLFHKYQQGLSASLIPQTVFSSFWSPNSI